MRGQALRFYVRLLLTRDFLRYLGPGFIITVGFIDLGNWARTSPGVTPSPTSCSG